MIEDGYVLVIGSAGMDVKGRPDAAIQAGTTNAGRVRHSVGGVARNIAENLARLEVATILLTAIGDDVEGLRVLDQSRAAGIDCAAVQVVPEQRTGSYLAFLTPEGDLAMAISDYAIMKHMDSAYLLQNEHLFAEAALLVIDATLAPATIATVFELAAKYQLRVCADPTIPKLATRLCPYLDQLYFIVPNAAETRALCGLPVPAHDRDTAIQAARGLVALGTEIAVVTMGDQGLAYADSKGAGFIRAQHTTVVDSTGAGDALTGAVIFALLNDVALDEAMRLGVTAASLTLQSRETVLPGLSQELLYATLVV